MNMVQATGDGGVPGPSTAMNGTALVGGLIMDGDKASILHAVLFAFAILIMFPFNVILVGFFRTTKLHMWFSGLIMVFVVTAFALGIYVSGEYNRVSNLCKVLLCQSYSAMEESRRIVLTPGD
jgi:RsiW-degrading membrane proteinase PrsW (M82 family)